jgi:hypothetical protein
MPYRAQLGGFLGGGTGAPAPHVLDIGGAIDAVTGGAASLIHQAYLRRQQQHAIEHQDAQLQLEREREEREAERDRNAAMANGVVPASTSVTRTPAAAAPAAPIGTIADALSARFNAAPAPTSPLEKPVDLPAFQGVNVTNEPAHYDPTYDPRRIRVLDGIDRRGAVQGDLEEKKQAGRIDRDAARHTFKLEEDAERAARAAERSADHDRRVSARGAAHDSRVTARGGAAGTRPLSANGQEVVKRTLLDGLVGYHGDETKVRDYLANDDVGKGTVQKYGITDADISAAVGRAQSKTEARDFSASTGFQRSNFDTPEAAGARVRRTHETATPKRVRVGPATPSAPAAGGPPAAGTAPPAVDPTSITDDEAASAYAAGARTDAEIMNHVIAARSKKK